MQHEISFPPIGKIKELKHKWMNKNDFYSLQYKSWEFGLQYFVQGCLTDFENSCIMIWVDIKRFYNLKNSSLYGNSTFSLIWMICQFIENGVVVKQLKVLKFKGKYSITETSTY